LARTNAPPQRRAEQPRSNQTVPNRRKRGRRAPQSKDVKIIVPNEETVAIDDKKRKREEIAEINENFIPLEPRKRSDEKTATTNAQKRVRQTEQETKNVDVALFEEFLAWKKEREVRQQEVRS